VRRKCRLEGKMRMEILERSRGILGNVEIQNEGQSERK
jgi:hypothetical protein